MRSWDWQAGGFLKLLLHYVLAYVSIFSSYRFRDIVKARLFGVVCCVVFHIAVHQLDQHSSDSLWPSDTTTQRPVWFLISLSSVQANAHLDSLRLVEVMCAKQLRIPAMFSVSHSTIFGKGCDDTHAHIIVQLITLSSCYFGTKSDADRLLCRMLQQQVTLDRWLTNRMLQIFIMPISSFYTVCVHRFLYSNNIALGGNECCVLTETGWMLLVCRKRIGKLRLDDSRSFYISGILYGRQSCNRFLSITKSATRSTRAFCHNLLTGIFGNRQQERHSIFEFAIRLSLHKLLVWDLLDDGENFLNSCLAAEEFDQHFYSLVNTN